MTTAIALPGIASAVPQTEEPARTVAAEVVGPFKGLTLTQAEECLDWLENHGYKGCKAQPDGDLWAVLLEAVPPLPAR